MKNLIEDITFWVTEIFVFSLFAGSLIGLAMIFIAAFFQETI